MIRLIATDLDGTLLRSDKAPSERVLRAIHDFACRGGIFVPVTGRPGPHVPDFIRNSPDIRYYLHSNGARCVDNRTGETVFLNPLSVSAARRVLECARPYEAIWHLFANGTFVRDDHGAGDPDSCLLKMLEEPGLELEKLDFTPAGQDDRNVLWSCIEKDSEVALSAAYSHNMEINGIGGDKGSAVTRLAQMLGIARSEIMAFGDGLNDIALLQAAGTAVAMGNAVPQLKAIADHVTLTNEEDGEAVAIEHFCFPGR